MCKHLPRSSPRLTGTHRSEGGDPSPLTETPIKSPSKCAERTYVQGRCMRGCTYVESDTGRSAYSFSPSSTIQRLLVSLLFPLPSYPFSRPPARVDSAHVNLSLWSASRMRLPVRPICFALRRHSLQAPASADAEEESFLLLSVLIVERQSLGEQASVVKSRELWPDLDTENAPSLIPLSDST